MARATDLPLPFPVVDAHPDCDAQGLHVVISFLAETIDPSVDIWDTALWDDPEATFTSDRIWLDVAGDVRGLVVEQGRNDLNGQPGAAHLVFELDNSTGRYDQWDTEGNFRTSPLGQYVAVYRDPDEWRFYGRVAVWEQDFGSGPNPAVRARQSKVTVEAWDAFELLAQNIDGIEYRLGAEGDTTGARLSYLASLSGFTRGFRLSPGNVTHRDLGSANPVLESMQVTAESDGGIVFIDVDGALTFLDRNDLTVGRSDVTQPVAVFTDSCEPGTYDFWEGDPVTDDRDVRSLVVLTNVDEVQVRREDRDSVDRYGNRLLALQAQTWRTAAEGTALADWVLQRRARLYFRVPELVRHVDGPEVRVGDRLRYVRDLPSGTRVDVDLLVEGWSLEYGPGTFLLTLSTTPVSALNAYTRWDETGSEWDNPETLWTF